MLTVNKLIAQARGLAPVLTRRAATVELDWDVRQKSRFDATDSSGRQLGVFLPRGTVVRGGDVLVAEDGTLVVVKAAAQPVLTVRHCADHGTPFDLLRAAYHLGNRHVALELQPDCLQLEPDHVLTGMLRQMHLIVSEGMAPFEPEGGAYSSGTQSGARHADLSGHNHAGLDTHEHAATAAAGDPVRATDKAAHGHAPQVHQQHDHGHHDVVGHHRTGAPAQSVVASADVAHVHGPGCSHPGNGS